MEQETTHTVTQHVSDFICHSSLGRWEHLRFTRGL